MASGSLPIALKSAVETGKVGLRERCGKSGPSMRILADLRDALGGIPRDAIREIVTVK